MKQYILILGFLAPTTFSWADTSLKSNATMQFSDSNEDVKKEMDLKNQCAFETYDKVLKKGGSAQFVKRSCFSAEEFSNVKYSWKPDQAFLQNKFPLSEPMRRAISAEDFEKMTQEEIDQIYIRLTSGPILPGEYRGKIVFNGTFSEKIQDFLERKISSNSKLVTMLKTLFDEKVCSTPANSDAKSNYVKCIGEMLWAGKKIYAPTEEYPIFTLRNGIAPLAAEAVNASFQSYMHPIDMYNAHKALGETKEPLTAKLKICCFRLRFFADSLYSTIVVSLLLSIILGDLTFVTLKN